MALKDDLNLDTLNTLRRIACLIAAIYLFFWGGDRQAAGLFAIGAAI